MRLRLDHVVIHVSDWEAADSFYRRVLGAEVIEREEGRRAYRFGDQQLNVHGPGTSPRPIASRPELQRKRSPVRVWMTGGTADISPREPSERPAGQGRAALRLSAG